MPIVIQASRIQRRESKVILYVLEILDRNPLKSDAPFLDTP
jgi:hypothetical protein